MTDHSPTIQGAELPLLVLNVVLSDADCRALETFILANRRQAVEADRASRAAGQEAVAWMYETDDHTEVTTTRWLAFGEQWKETPLYAAHQSSTLAPEAGRVAALPSLAQAVIAACNRIIEHEAVFEGVDFHALKLAAERARSAPVAQAVVGELGVHEQAPRLRLRTLLQVTRSYLDMVSLPGGAPKGRKRAQERADRESAEMEQDELLRQCKADLDEEIAALTASRPEASAAQPTYKLKGSEQ